MKKRLAALFCATLAASMILVGCQASKGLETDNLKITQYKGVEVSAVAKPEKNSGSLHNTAETEDYYMFAVADQPYLKSQSVIKLRKKTKKEQIKKEQKLK